MEHSEDPESAVRSRKSEGPELKAEDKKTEHCMVCGELLGYRDRAEEIKCVYCGRIDQGHILCPEGHYICDTCHNQDAMQIIKNTIFTTRSSNPFEISELVMSFSGLPMVAEKLNVPILTEAFPATLVKKNKSEKV